MKSKKNKDKKENKNKNKKQALVHKGGEREKPREERNTDNR